MCLQKVWPSGLRPNGLSCTVYHATSDLADGFGASLQYEDRGTCLKIKITLVSPQKKPRSFVTTSKTLTSPGVQAGRLLHHILAHGLNLKVFLEPAKRWTQVLQWMHFPKRLKHHANAQGQLRPPGVPQDREQRGLCAAWVPSGPGHVLAGAALPQPSPCGVHLTNRLLFACPTLRPQVPLAILTTCPGRTHPCCQQHQPKQKREGAQEGATSHREQAPPSQGPVRLSTKRLIRRWRLSFE